MMRMRLLGEGGPEVSVVGLGTNNFGGRFDYDQTLAVIDAALDAGITLFDTADIYGQGTSEEYIGRALEGRRDQRRARDEVRQADGRANPSESARHARLHPLGGRGLAPPAPHRRDRPLPDAPARRRRRSRRRSARSTSSSARARCASSAPRTSPPRRSRRPSEVARERGLRRASSRRRTSTRSSSARRRTRCCPRASGSASASCRTSRSRAACSPASTRAARRRPRDGSPGREIADERWDRVEALQRFADERGDLAARRRHRRPAALPAVVLRDRGRDEAGAGARERRRRRSGSRPPRTWRSCGRSADLRREPGDAAALRAIFREYAAWIGDDVWVNGLRGRAGGAPRLATTRSSSPGRRGERSAPSRSSRSGRHLRAEAALRPPVRSRYRPRQRARGGRRSTEPASSATR